MSRKDMITRILSDKRSTELNSTEGAVPDKCLRIGTGSQKEAYFCTFWLQRRLTTFNNGWKRTPWLNVGIKSTAL